MRKLYVVATIIGLMLGPLYGAYCRYFSGEAMETVELFEPLIENGNAKPAESGSAKFHFAPDMNPIGLTVRIRVNQKKQGIQKVVRFNVSLMRHDDLIWKKAYGLGLQKTGFNRQSDDPIERGKNALVTKDIGKFATIQSQLNSFEVQASDVYTLTMTQTGQKDVLKVDSLEVTARRNISLVNKWVFITGCALLAFGIIGFVRSQKK